MSIAWIHQYIFHPSGQTVSDCFNDLIIWYFTNLRACIPLEQRRESSRLIAKSTAGDEGDSMWIDIGYLMYIFGVETLVL